MLHGFIHKIHCIVYLTVERPNLNQQAENNSLVEKLDDPTPVLLPGKSHGRRSMVGYSLWGHKDFQKSTLNCSSILCVIILSDKLFFSPSH